MKKKFTISYQYTVYAKAVVEADSLEEAVAIVETDAPCPDPIYDHNIMTGDEIKSVDFSYLESSFEVHTDELNLHNPEDSE